MDHTSMSLKSSRFGPDTPERLLHETVRRQRPANRKTAAWHRHLDFTSLDWWCWATLSISLIGAISGSEAGHRMALVLAGVQVVIWFLRNRNPASLPTQVRVVFLLLFAASFHPFFGSLKWGLAAGTASTAVLGYCPIARILMLMPFNQSDPSALGL